MPISESRGSIQPFFYIETSDHYYSDFICADSSITSDKCQSSFAKLNSTMNWKLLSILSSSFDQSLSKKFNYNITFSKAYTTLDLGNIYLNVSLNNFNNVNGLAYELNNEIELNNGKSNSISCFFIV